MIRIGMFLGDRYEILEKIGSGGMADMFKGRDHKLNRLVAVKVLKDEFVEDKNFVRKFKEEAQAAAGLAHPNIVNVYDVGDEQNINYIVMELVEGITLKNYIERKGRLTVKEATSIAIQVSSGLEVAHSNNIIHRDIKPQNIMISKEGKVKVTDFGIAKSVSSHTNTSDAMGSVHYTSPEQARGGYSDAKSDIYSLGIVLYEMVTGRVPFDGETTVVVAVKHLQEEMVSPRVYASDVPVSLEQIILKCTQKSPDRRYANIGALQADLKQSLVTPDVNFVQMVDVGGAKTVALTRDDISKIKQETGRVPLAGAGVAAAAGKTAEKKSRKLFEEEDPFADVYEEEEPDYDEYDEYDEDEDDDDDGELDPRLEKILTWGGIAAALIIVVIIIVIILKLFGCGGNKETEVKDPGNNIDIMDVLEEEPEEIEVPDLLGKSYIEAKELLNEQGLGIMVGETKTSDEYEEGQIMGQSIAAGEMVELNTTITVDICGGEEAAIPNVAGESEGNAKKILTDAGFNVDINTQYSDTVAEGKVIATSPKAGYMASKGSVVNIIISKGPEAGKVAVPEIVGRTEERAKEKLTEAKLTVGTVTEDFSDTVEKGYIISQSVAAGTMIPEGTAISYVISKGPKTEEVYIGDYSGMKEADAVKKAEDRGLKTAVDYEYSSSVANGIVIRTDPGNGSSVKTGSTLKIIVSKGSQPAENVTITNVVGMDQATAKSTLEGQGFVVSVSEGYGTAADKGKVISMTPGGGTTAAKGSTVTITVSKGQNPDTCTHSGYESDGVCDVCGKTGLTVTPPPCSTHTDANNDGTCDTCGTTGLTITPPSTICTTPADANSDNVCDSCGQAAHS